MFAVCRAPFFGEGVFKKPFDNPAREFCKKQDSLTKGEAISCNDGKRLRQC